jgi:DNA-binding PadR family transcriptional regulator
MSLKHGILGLLTYSPMSGYDLMKAFNESLKFFWSAQTSQIYRELETLASSGWIETQGESQRGHLVKTVFAITGEGRAELLRWLREGPDDRSGGRSPFLLRLFFSSIGGTGSIRELVEARKAQAEAQAAELRDVIDRIIPERLGRARNKLAAFCWTQAAEYGLSQFEAEARWAEACLAEVDARKGAR